VIVEVMLILWLGVSYSVALAQPKEVNLLAGKDEYETLGTFFACMHDLSFAERVVCVCFHTCGPGRPPRNPLGFFRAFIVMRMKGVRSLREMVRLLNVDCRLRKLCLISEGEKGYPRSVLSRFTKRVGDERLKRIMDACAHKIYVLANVSNDNCAKCGREYEINSILHRRFDEKLWRIKSC